MLIRPKLSCWFRILALAGLVLLGALPSSGAWADQGGARIVVVEITSDLDLDPDALREGIASEFGVVAVTPNDPRAVASTGTVRVVIEQATSQLTVSYEERPRPTSRTVDLPSGGEEVATAAALLAGNVARNEAREMLQPRRKVPRCSGRRM